MGSPEDAGKRINKRVLIVQDLIINGKPLGQAIDLSIDGMYIHSEAPITMEGAVIDLKFHLGSRPIQVKAKITFRHKGIGMGVKFLSLKSTDAEAIKAFIENSAARHAPRTSDQKQILIIDDTDFYRNVYQNRLMAKGYSVRLARSGTEGLKMLVQERPDLILLDLVMDGMDGYKILEILKKEPDLRDVPVIVFSVRGSAAEIARAKELGAKDYLVKSKTSPNEALEKIAKLFRRRPRPTKTLGRK